LLIPDEPECAGGRKSRFHQGLGLYRNGKKVHEKCDRNTFAGVEVPVSVDEF